MTQLNKAVVLLTGATGGFGQELTRLLLAAGSQLILTDKDVKPLQEQTQTLRNHSHPGQILDYVGTDLATLAGCQSLYHEVKALDQPIDILINNAGIALYGRMDEVPAEKWGKADAN